MTIDNYQYINGLYRIKTTNLETTEGAKRAISTLTLAFSDFVSCDNERRIFKCEFYENDILIEDNYISLFWTKIAKIKHAHDDIFIFLNLVKNHMKSGSVTKLDDENCGLGEHALYALSMVDIKFVPMYSEFLYLWDMGHEVMQSEEIEDIINQYGWCIEVENLIIARATCNGQHDFEDLESFEDLIKENVKDLSSSAFFKRLVYKTRDLVDEGEWKDSLEWFILPYMHDAAIELVENYE
ncbi:protein of unknown function [Tenacibaculum soleae]|uniref:hypothetical protein n=1 Tax=Tenacibaculum soleae TaxID=447689 RepID=UPI003AB67B45